MERLRAISAVRAVPMTPSQQRAFEANERIEALRRIPFGYGLNDEQIDDVMRLIDRIATESVLRREQAEQFVDFLSDCDDDMRGRFEREVVDGVLLNPDFRQELNAWLFVARRIMTERKGAQLRASLGI